VQSFSYTVADDAPTAVRLLAAQGASAKFLAGGTNLYDLMKLGAETPDAVVDVTRIPGFDAVDTTGGHELIFGAGARMCDVAEDSVLLSAYPALAESLTKASSQQLRTMATIGGNLMQRTRCPYFRGGPAYPCNKRDPGSGCAAIGGSDRTQALLGTSVHCTATYPGDWAVALVAFDAVLDVLGPDGQRTLPVAELHREPTDRPHVETTLARDELILRVRVPVSRAGRGSAYLKARDRQSYAFALASAAVALTLDENGKVTDARVALGGVATRPWRSPEAEQALLGSMAHAGDGRAAGAVALAAAVPGRDNAFRLDLAARTVAEAVLVAAGRARS